MVLIGALIALTTGCHGPISSLWPPAIDAPTTRVWVVDHGWHTGLVLERTSIPPGLLPEQDDFPSARYLELGWGDADFYRTRDAGFWLALRAAFFSNASVIHMVSLSTSPEKAGDIVEIRLSRQGFDALSRFVDRSFDRQRLRTSVGPEQGLYSNSAFYPSRDRYHLLNTCNTWVAEALRAAGLPITPAYAMTAGNLMWQIRRLDSAVVERAWSSAARSSKQGLGPWGIICPGCRSLRVPFDLLTEGNLVKYLLMIYLGEAWDKQPLAEREAIYLGQVRLSDELTARGQYLGGNPLYPASTATSVRVRDGKRLLTDGPFAETREQLGGYILIDVPNLDDAIAIAARCPAASVGTVEVRPVREGPPR